VNRKARRRLLIAVAVVVVAFAAGVVWLVRAQGAYYRQVGELSTAGLDGKTVKVGGAVVPGSIVKDGAVQSFIMKDLTGRDATVAVHYEGTVPDTFGPDVDVVVLGVYRDSEGLIDAQELQTKCPSKYEASKSPAPSAASSP
jgi:cytochrome c-type biogenesis protein CcmE